jgi:prevent-host-death family protein
VSSRQFNQDISSAKRAAQDGPVIVTDRGVPAYVLLTHDAYQRLTGAGPSIRALLEQPGIEDVEFEPLRLESLFRPEELDQQRR